MADAANNYSSLGYANVVPSSEKRPMTREEAKRILKKYWDAAACADMKPIDSTIDSYVALGMLKLDESKSARETLENIVLRHTSDGQARCILNAIAKAGLKIVEK